jgi:hypothetical protein
MAMTQTQLIKSDGGHQRIEILSLAIGPMLLSVGDLMHPAESLDAARQAAIIAEQPDRWYLAHVLILVGFALFLPGLLMLAAVVSARWPRTGQVGRLLILIGACGFSAMIALELLAGRLTLLNPTTAQSILDARSSAPVALPLITMTLGFFIGSIMLMIRMIRGIPAVRWPTAGMLVGVLLIAAEIGSGQVVLSQVGNVLVWIGAIAFAVRLQRGDLDDVAAMLTASRGRAE